MIGGDHTGFIVVWDDGLWGPHYWDTVFYVDPLLIVFQNDIQQANKIPYFCFVVYQKFKLTQIDSNVDGSNFIKKNILLLKASSSCYIGTCKLSSLQVNIQIMDFFFSSLIMEHNFKKSEPNLTLEQCPLLSTSI